MLCIVIYHQIDAAIKLSVLVQRLQDERASVALGIFVLRTTNVAEMKDLQQYVDNGINVSHYDNIAVRHHCRYTNMIKDRKRVYVELIRAPNMLFMFIIILDI